MRDATDAHFGFRCRPAGLMVARDLGPFGSHNGMLAMNEEELKAAVLINLKAENMLRFASGSFDRKQRGYIHLSTTCSILQTCLQSC
jgi:hypothetical protein